MAINVTSCEQIRCDFFVDGKCVHWRDNCYRRNIDDTDMVDDLELLNELRKLAKRKHELWEEDLKGFGLTWREDGPAQEYQKLEDRIWEIERELFGDYVMEI